MIRWLTAFLDLPASSFERDVAFWQTVTGTRLSAPRGRHDEFATLLPPTGDAFVKVQRIDDGAARLHLDLHVDDVAEAAARAAALGATVVAEHSYVVMRSPGGFVFCFVSHRSNGERPVPVEVPGGGARSLVDQVCVDVPADLFDAEAAFWTTLTGWEHRATGRPELEVLVRPTGMPLRILLQRLGTDDPGDAARAHLDLACGEGRDVVTAWHRALGAEEVRRESRWTTLRDPAGLAYCLTARDPDTGLLPT